MLNASQYANAKVKSDHTRRENMRKKATKLQQITRLLSLLLTGAIFITTQGFTVVAQTVSDNEIIAMENGEANASKPSEDCISSNSISANAVQAATESLWLDPLHHCTNLGAETDTTTWSYVWFGTYPQTEITDSEITSAIDSAIKDGLGTVADAGSDVWVNGVKYRRISKADATFGGRFGDNTYRYFKWEKIKWRVLKNEGSTLFVMADMGLDCEQYHKSVVKVTWETCDLRKWLNDSFYNAAFTADEQKAVILQDVVNDDNWMTYADGGNDTKDNVYLLAIDEVRNLDYGFCIATANFSPSRQLQISDYTVAKGSSRSEWEAYLGTTNWWLRSPGSRGRDLGEVGYASDAATCSYVGEVNLEGTGVTFNGWAVVPVLHIDIKSDQWSVSEDNTEKNIETVQTPTASVAGGSYNEVQNVTLSTKTKGATIYYTTDGSKPSIANGTKYKTAITIDKSQTLKAIAVKSRMKDSEVMTEQYTISLPEKKEEDKNTGETGNVDDSGSGSETGKQNETATTVEEAEKKITSTNTDKGDVTGSKFSSLQLKATGKNKSVKLTWKKVKDADGYIVYGAKCGNSMKKIKTLKGNKKVSYTQTKLKKGKFYKYMVVAYKNVDGKKCTIATSKSAHAVTNGGKYGNPTKVTVKSSKMTIKKGKKKTIKASYTLPKGKKASIHIAKFRYESSNTKVATVSKKGVVKAKKKGTAYIYVYAQNGVYKKVKVTVK